MNELTDRRARYRPGLLAVGLVTLLGACVPSPPEVRQQTTPGRDIDRRTEYDLAQNSYRRYAKELTYRVRGASCGGVSWSGSAFAIDANLLVSNEHVVSDDIRYLELSTWDGQDITVEIAATATLADVALIWTDQPLPIVAPIGTDPSMGTSVHAVGYPGGREWTLTSGAVVGYQSGIVLDDGNGGSIPFEHEVIAFDATVEPGNSGGPLLNDAGEVVGVVFAVNDQYGFAVPVSVLEFLIDNQAFVASAVRC